MIAALFLPVLVIAIIGIIRVGSYFFESAHNQPPLPEKNATWQRRLRGAGIFILVAGLLAAGVTYRNAPAEDEGGAIGYEMDGGTEVPVMPGDSKSYDQQMEGMGGTVSVLAAEVAGWFHGRKLAYTLAFLSLGGCLLCFIFAHLQAYAPPPDNH